ncbi:MAG: HU family DNA-binding protein [Actinomycetota bacterium]
MAKSLNRSAFLKEVADRTGAHKRDVEHVWENALGVIRDNVKKGTAVSITGFGKFGQRVRKARPAGMQRNPFTGEMVKVAARPKSAVPRFAPAKQFKEYVGGGMKAWPKSTTKPMALAAASAPAKKATAKKAAPKKAAKKAAPKKKARRR